MIQFNLHLHLLTPYIWPIVAYTVEIGFIEGTNKDTEKTSCCNTTQRLIYEYVCNFR